LYIDPITEEVRTLVIKVNIGNTAIAIGVDLSPESAGATYKT